MVTIITKKYCHMFNMKNHGQELQLCALFQRMRGRKKDQNKIVRVNIKETSLSRPVIYKILICNIDKIMWEERVYDVQSGVYIKEFVHKYEHKFSEGEIK